MDKGRTGPAGGRAGWFRRLAARLLVALAVLALPIAPPATAGAGGHDRHHRAAPSDCDAAAGLAAAAPASHHEGGHRHGDEGDHTPAPAACCPMSQCPVPPGALPQTPARAAPPAGARAAAPAPGPLLHGLDVPPALPPPRAAAA